MGAQFALMEARIVLATLVQRFRPSVAPGRVVGIDPQPRTKAVRARATAIPILGVR
jgi:cytochrome P450